MTKTEILKLAKECGWPEEAGEPECGSLNLEAFYRAAFNAGIEAAAKHISKEYDKLLAQKSTRTRKHLKAA